MERYVTNLQVLSDDQQAVAGAVTALDDLGPALVGPALGGWVGVYPESLEMHVAEECEAAAAGLSRQTGRVVLGLMVHAGDVLLYWLAEGGRVIDRYCSNVEFLVDLVPGVEETFAGDVALLASSCQRLAALAALKQALSRAFPGLATDQLAAVANALGIEGAGWSYEDLLAGAGAPCHFLAVGGAPGA